MDLEGKNSDRGIRFWKCWAFALAVLSLGLIVALVAVVVVLKNEERTLGDTSKSTGSAFPCPVQSGGLVTSGDPDSPGPFHDLTLAEYARVYDFLRKQQELNLAPPEKEEMNVSSIFILDLLLPPKREVVSFLDEQGLQPPREARVILFRGDKTPPVLEE